jgi:nucleotide-binding universal stress UspA family protein
VNVTTIVCGTDFSIPAVEATRVAATLAQQLGGTLRLVHVQEDGGDDRAQVHLEREASVLRVPQIEASVRSGSPDDELIASAQNADLIVVGSIGHRHGAHWFIGSTAESLAERSHIPVLVIRRSEPLCEAIEKKRRASVVVATDLAPDFHPVVLWVGQWRAAVPSDVHLVYVSNPVAEYERLQIPGRIDRREPHPLMADDLTRELKQLAGQFAENGIDASFTMTLGATSREVVRIAEEQHADLIVIGAHQRSRLTRAWRESVAHGVLHSAETNVAVIPLGHAA